MNRDEAKKLVGKRVSIWTAANGQYSGIFEEVLTSKGRPWRAKVRVDGVLAVAQHYEQGSVCRRGFRPGETMEVGGSSIKPTDQQGVDYITALEQAIATNWARYNRNPEGRDAWVNKAFAQAQELALKAEHLRLETGEWNLRAVVDEASKQNRKAATENAGP